METYMLYTLAAQFNRRALSVNTVADHFETKGKTKPERVEYMDLPRIEFDTGKNMTPEEREKGFSKMIAGVLNIN